MANTYVSPEDRKADPPYHEISANGDATAIPGFDKEKALAHAEMTAFTLEYRWYHDPGDDPFVNLPSETAAA